VIELLPGQTTNIVLGGKGRAVVGHIDLPKAILDRDDWQWQGDISSHDDVPPKPMPDDVRNGTAAQRHSWQDAFQKTPEGKAWLTAARKAMNSFQSFPMEIQPDGSFRIEDVPEGKYEVSVTIWAQATDGEVVQLATGDSKFVIPSMPGGRSDEPLQIDSVPLHLEDIAILGKPAPAFAAPLLGGGTLNLADFRGHYVLLDFWATTCTPCVEEMEHLKPIYDEFGKTGKLEIIGLSSDETAQRALSYVQKQHIYWHQCWVGDNTGKRTFENYIDSEPQIWLIDPEGIVIAKGLRDDKIRSVVESTLNKH
jgi:thiol-disulfide isomerase/thioredoxin